MVQSTVTATQVLLGSELGLYKAMCEMDGQMSARALAEKTNLHERWVQEWLLGQAAASFVDILSSSAAAKDQQTLLFQLNPHQKEVVLNLVPNFGLIRAYFTNIPQIASCFRTGRGLLIDKLGPEVITSSCSLGWSWIRKHFCSRLSDVEGLHDQLDKGIRVADVGCCDGALVLLLAARYPRSSFVGFDTSSKAIERARQLLKGEGLTNVEFTTEELPDQGQFGLITCVNALHNSNKPQALTRKIRLAMRDDAVWLLVDIKASTNPHENTRQPLSALIYGMSVNVSLPTSLLEDEGMENELSGMGAYGLSSERVVEFARNAGFRYLRVMSSGHPIFSFFEVRPSAPAPSDVSAATVATSSVTYETTDSAVL